MSLEVLEGLLNAAETGDAAAMEAVEDHIRTCAACRAEVDKTGNVLQGLHEAAGGEHPRPEHLAELLEEDAERRFEARSQHVRACGSCQTDLSLLREFDQPGEAPPAPPPDAAQRIWAALQRRQIQRVAAAVVVALVGRRVVLRSGQPRRLPSWKPSTDMAVRKRDGEVASASDERMVGDWRVHLEFTPHDAKCSIRLTFIPPVESAWMPMVSLVAEDGSELQRLSPAGDVVSLPPQIPGRYSIKLHGPTWEELGVIPVVIEAESPQI